MAKIVPILKINNLAFTSYILPITYLTAGDLAAALQVLHLHLLQSIPNSVVQHPEFIIILDKGLRSTHPQKSEAHPLPYITLVLRRETTFSCKSRQVQYSCPAAHVPPNALAPSSHCITIAVAVNRMPLSHSACQCPVNSPDRRPKSMLVKWREWQRTGSRYRVNARVLEGVAVATARATAMAIVLCLVISLCAGDCAMGIGIKRCIEKT